MAVEGWMPRPWKAELAGCIWLPRLLDKGRRALESERQGQDLMNGYLLGDNDYADAQLLKFLNTQEQRVLELLRETSDDQGVAERLVHESGRSAEEIRAWNERFRKVNAPFIAMWEADEGQRQSGWGTTLLDLFYNYVLMPPVYLVFRVAKRRQQRQYRGIHTL
jgi:hypothetical protein